MGIEISIKAGADEATSYVNASGSVEHIITDEERTTFGIQSGDLKDAVDEYFGKRPNNAYLHSPTPWDDLYKRYNWSEVQTVLIVQSATIRGITSEPVIVATKSFANKSSRKATFDCSISDQVTDTVESNWSQMDTITVGQKIKYEIGFLGTGGGGETSISYSHSWGEGGSVSKSVTVGSSSGVQVELNPGESVKAKLTASRGVMKVRIVYRAYLIGDTALNYNPRYKDHHFWALDIESVMSAASLPSIREYTEDIEIGYYSNSKVELKDSAGNQVGMFFAADKAAVDEDIQL